MHDVYRLLSNEILSPSGPARRGFAAMIPRTAPFIPPGTSTGACSASYFTNRGSSILCNPLCMRNYTRRRRIAASRAPIGSEPISDPRILAPTSAAASRSRPRADLPALPVVGELGTASLSRPTRAPEIAGNGLCTFLAASGGAQARHYRISISSIIAARGRSLASRRCTSTPTFRATISPPGRERPSSTRFPRCRDNAKNSVGLRWRVPDVLGVRGQNGPFWFFMERAVVS